MTISMGGAYDGIRVLDCTEGIAGPTATMHLADFGADVLKVETPAGDRLRDEPGYLCWNRNKRFCRLDAGDYRDLSELRRLIAAADAVRLRLGRRRAGVAGPGCHLAARRAAEADVRLDAAVRSARPLGSPARRAQPARRGQRRGGFPSRHRGPSGASGRPDPRLHPGRARRGGRRGRAAGPPPGRVRQVRGDNRAARGRGHAGGRHRRRPRHFFPRDAQGRDGVAGELRAVPVLGWAVAVPRGAHRGVLPHRPRRDRPDGGHGHAGRRGQLREHPASRGVGRRAAEDAGALRGTGPEQLAGGTGQGRGTRGSGIEPGGMVRLRDGRC